ncbi:MAG: DNA polymerase IV [Erysipelothrix sp.]|nr:DNA polymerase IV [Erysipelothrix sp.]
MSVRIIFHIDINSFFASAHIAKDPSLKGEAVVVCHHVKGNVITSASYEARYHGIETAMILSEARKLYPAVKPVFVDFELYTELSEKFYDLISTYSTEIEQASVDEVYVDLTDKIKEYAQPLDLATEIQKRMLDELSLPVNIGIAPNKFLAKMASDMNKPLGITVLRKREVQSKLWPLPIEEMFGIGRKTVPRLHEIDVFTIGDLVKQPFEKVKAVLANRAQYFVDLANGIGSNDIDTNTTAKSIGQSQTFTKAIHEIEEVKSEILHDIETLSRRARQDFVKGKTIQFSIGFENKETSARSRTLDYYINDTKEIFERVMLLFGEFENQDYGGVTFISTTLTNLKDIREIEEQLDLFKADIQNDEALKLEDLEVLRRYPKMEMKLHAYKANVKD